MSQFDYYPKILPWDQIIDDLRRAGVGPYKVAQLIDAKWSTFQKWEKSVEPRHSYAVAILKLHSETCGEILTAQRISEATIRYSS